MKKIIKYTNGFTLVETLTSTIVIGILLTFLGSILFSNWSAYEEGLSRTNLREEAYNLLETITFNGRSSTRAVLQSETNQKVIEFLDGNDDLIATYTMTNTGRIQFKDENDVITTLSEKLDFSTSGFQQDGSTLIVTLNLIDKVFRRTVSFNTSTEIFFRNYNNVVSTE